MWRRRDHAEQMLKSLTRPFYIVLEDARLVAQQAMRSRVCINTQQELTAGFEELMARN